MSRSGWPYCWEHDQRGDPDGKNRQIASFHLFDFVLRCALL